MESKEREAYRMKCEHRGILSGLCCKKSHYYSRGVLTVAVDIACTPDCNCLRMKRFDKQKKEEKI